MSRPKVVNCKSSEPFEVYIGRPSKWGNPYSHLPNTAAIYRAQSRAEAIKKFEEWITKGSGKHLLADLHELKGKTLGCHCKPLACHGDVLLRLANA